MKRFFCLMIVALGLFLTTPASAQFHLGVKGGLNMSELDWNGGVKGNTDYKTGFFIGPMAEFTIPIIGLGVDAAVLFSQRGDDEFKQQGIELPVNLKYTIGLGSVLGIYLAAGPDFYYNLKDMDGFESTKKPQIAVNVGGGLKLLRHLQLGVNYLIPVNKPLKSEGVSFKTKGWQVSLAYIF